MSKYIFTWDSLTPDEIAQFFKNAPAWAKYFAVDACLSGNGYFYGKEPVINHDLDRWECVNYGDPCIPAGSGHPTTNWEKSLLKRA